MTTPEPLEVFDCELDGITLIEASAGTGKTWNICALYLRLLLERGLSVEQILVVTFTRAATAELRDRIRTRIVSVLTQVRGSRDPSSPDAIFTHELLKSVSARVSLSNAALVNRLETALNLFDEAAIYTIHGFCQRVLTDSALTTGSPYQVEMIEDDGLMRRAAVADFWRRSIASKPLDPALTRHLREGRQGPDQWAQLLKRVQDRPLAVLEWPPEIETIRPPESPLAGDCADADYQAAFLAAQEIWLVDRTSVLLTLQTGLSCLNKNSYNPRSIQQSAIRWDETLTQHTGSLLGLAAEDKIHLLTQSKLSDRTLRGKETPTHRFFSAAEQLIEYGRQLGARCQLRLRQLQREMIDVAGGELKRHKQEQRLVSYNDILLNTWEALTAGSTAASEAGTETGSKTGPVLAATLRARYPAALIDEFQDTDPLQCGIFLNIYGDGSVPLFFVGDPKQAIYSFRNADIHAYLQAKRHVKRFATLAQNQRSVSGLVAACNALFSANAAAFIQTGIDYRPVKASLREREPLVEDHDPNPQWPMQLWYLPRDDAGALLARADAKHWAISQTVAEIARLLNSPVQIEGRALCGGDIAVLVRSHNQGRSIREALSGLGIPSVELSQASVWNSPEAVELERVLQAILSPADAGLRQRLLLGALATDLMGLNAQAVLAQRVNEEGLNEFSKRFAQYLKDWRRQGFAFMFQHWREREAVDQRLLDCSDGERRLTNLLHLGELLQRANHQAHSPEALLRWMRVQRAEPESTDDIQLRLESDRNLVQIVTIHKSKGLEYGIVFCPLLWLDTPSKDSKTVPVEDRDNQGRSILDFRIDPPDPTGRKNRRRAADEAEAVRLIYVALTRAVHRCYLVVGPYSKTGGLVPSKESHCSLLNWMAAGDGFDRAAWSDLKPEADRIEKGWRMIETAAGGQIGWRTPAENPQSIAIKLRSVQAGIAEPGQSQERPHHPGWVEGSFSSLTRTVASGYSEGSDHDPENRVPPHHAAADHDAYIESTEDVRAAGLSASDILLFPRGAKAGECIHSVFEQIDFTDPSGWDPQIDRALVQFGLSSDPLNHTRLRQLISDVLTAPLAEGFTLSQITRRQRLNELGFRLTAPTLGAEQWNAWLRSHQIPAPQLQFGLAPRYLQGYIDLIFQFGTRFYILDWKSNHLGYSSKDYSGQSLEDAMQAHGYHLQSLLYSVALHRYLRQRVTNYDYTRHVGGSLYGFVRGMRPDWSDSNGHCLGLYTHRLPVETITAFDQLLKRA